MSEKETEEKILADYLLSQCYINPLEKVDHPPVAISYGTYSHNTREGVMTYPSPIGTYGNFSFVQGPPKTQKTFFTSLISAAYLGGESERFVGKLKGHNDNKCLIHFDTEQGIFHAQRTFSRVLEMSGADVGCYRTYGLRPLSHKERIISIKSAIEDQENAGLVIIDGIADLLGDVNNIEEANEVVQMLMRWSQEYNVHIMTIIHSNYDSSKPTGHLGSALEKKAETQIMLERDKTNPSMINVYCRRSRNRPFEGFSFYVNDFGYPQVAYEDLNFINDLINSSHG